MEEEVLKRARPLVFRPHAPDNCLLKAETDFARTCAALEDNHISRPAELSVFEFEMRLEYLKEKFSTNNSPTPEHSGGGRRKPEADDENHKRPGGVHPR